MTAAEYVERFCLCTVKREKKDEDDKLTDEMIEKALDDIEQDIRNELVSEIQSMNQPIPDWKIRNAVVDANQKWNQISDLLFQIFGIRVLTPDHIMNLWFEILDQVM